jgi:chemotaxis protein histidine kinase CheA
MDKLIQQVRRARTRLLVEKYLHWLVWSLFGTLLVATVAIAVPRVFVIEGLPANWDALWAIGAGAAALLAAGIATWATRTSPLDAAIEIDRRFGLRERVASSLSLAPDEMATPAGQALVNDAAKRIERIEVGEKFRPQVERRAWLPLVPGLVALVLALFVSNRSAESSALELARAEEKARVQEASEVVRKTMAEQRKLAEQKNLKEAEEAFKQLEESAKELESKNEGDRKQAAIKLNNLKKQLEERRNEIGTSSEFKKQMEAMKDLGQGPADKVAEAVKQGDWKKAMEEIDKLRDKIAKDDLSPEDKQQLSDQLEKMKNKLAEAAQQQRDTMEELKKQIEEQKKQGNLAKAGELQQKLDQMQQQQQQMDQLDKLAQQMAQCQDCLNKGDKEGAAQAMQQMADQLKQMEKEMGEMEMLDEALQQLEMAKNAMGCEECNGKGCQACQGGQMAGNGGKGEGQGNGMGQGQGTGFRPDEKNDTKFRDSQVRQKPGAGASTFGGFVDGPNLNGETAAAVQEEMQAIKPQPADPLTIERLPRSHAENAEQYFEQLRDL